VTNKYNYEIGEIIMSHQHYEPEFKKKLVRLHLEEGRTLQSLSAEYGVAKASITIWCRKFSNECLEQALTNPIAPNELEIMKENRRLRAELGEAHKKFDNLINQNFTASGINQKWATDFTYLFLRGGDVRYNCTIIDLYDRSVVASITDRHITSDLAIRTLQKALESQKSISKDIILHSDQGSQYTSKSFTEFCEKKRITQSMSKAGYPYDNAPMERYFNTLKNEEIYLHNYHKE
jgi:ISCps2, transposase orfB